MKISLKTARLMMEMSQNEAQNIFKISQATLSRIENGEPTKSKKFYSELLSQHFNSWRLQMIENLQCAIKELKQLTIK